MEALAPQPTAATAPAAAAPVSDDLEKYLALPAETNMDLDRRARLVEGLTARTRLDGQSIRTRVEP